jgi:hypothetical protein
MRRSGSDWRRTNKKRDDPAIKSLAGKNCRLLIFQVTAGVRKKREEKQSERELDGDDVVRKLQSFRNMLVVAP